MLELLAKQQDDWIRIAYNMTEDMDEAKDLVQEMYVVVLEGKRSIKDITYKDEINRYFVWKLLRSLFIDNYRKKNSKKSIKTCELIIDKDDRIIEEYNLSEDNSFDYIQSRIDEIVSGFDIQYRQLYNLYFIDGLSYRGISSRSSVPVSWIRPRVLEVKERLIEELGEDVTDYFNQDYDKI